jgi:hypothetical protein
MLKNFCLLVSFLVVPCLNASPWDGPGAARPSERESCQLRCHALHDDAWQTCQYVPLDLYRECLGRVAEKVQQCASRCGFGR